MKYRMSHSPFGVASSHPECLEFSLILLPARISFSLSGVAYRILSHWAGSGVECVRAAFSNFCVS